MLRITVDPGLDDVRLTLEGDLVGTNVRILEEFWLTSSASFAGAAVSVDLGQVTRVDDAGKFLLALIHRTGARLLASGVEMRELVDSIALDWPLPGAPPAGTSAAHQAARRGPRA
jgi:hypothetical protein